jgi:EAL domain-containing protein (putative c-di-GMP-specific phosphodiesterase class I)
LLYQPQHALEGGTLLGYEALVRWIHPEYGLISPVDFIPMAEQSGDIFAIGEWVLNEAARAAAQWDDDLKIAVNLSPVQLQQEGLVQMITGILIDSGLPARRLELEITEGAIIADRTRALHVLRQIKALGISIALDDFGTGYSSLDTLGTFPIDKIKIDKSFLLRSAGNVQAATILRAVLALGRSLDIPVLAEGSRPAPTSTSCATKAAPKGRATCSAAPRRSTTTGARWLRPERGPEGTPRRAGCLRRSGWPASFRCSAPARGRSRQRRGAARTSARCREARKPVGAQLFFRRGHPVALVDHGIDMGRAVALERHGARG